MIEFVDKPWDLLERFFFTIVFPVIRQILFRYISPVIGHV